jgi:hypothetical protein
MKQTSWSQTFITRPPPRWLKDIHSDWSSSLTPLIILILFLIFEQQLDDLFSFTRDSDWYNLF